MSRSRYNNESVPNCQHCNQVKHGKHHIKVYILTYKVTQGVKQGYHLYCFFYLDNLIADLRSLTVGCHINRLFVGAVVYADDITLLGPSRSGYYDRDCDVLLNPRLNVHIFLKCNQSSGKQMSVMNNDVVYVFCINVYMYVFRHFIG